MFNSGAVDAANVLRVDTEAVRVDFEDDEALYAAYMPFVTNGGLFVHAWQLSNMNYMFGSDVFLLLHLQAQNERMKVRGRTVWICARPGSQRPPGIGVQFRDKGETRRRVEQILASRLAYSEQPTHTL